MGAQQVVGGLSAPRYTLLSAFFPLILPCVDDIKLRAPSSASNDDSSRWTKSAIVYFSFYKHNSTRFPVGNTTAIYVDRYTFHRAWPSRAHTYICQFERLCTYISAHSKKVSAVTDASYEALFSSAVGANSARPPRCTSRDAYGSEQKAFAARTSRSRQIVRAPTHLGAPSLAPLSITARVVECQPFFSPFFKPQKLARLCRTEYSNTTVMQLSAPAARQIKLFVLRPRLLAAARSQTQSISKNFTQRNAQSTCAQRTTNLVCMRFAVCTSFASLALLIFAPCVALSIFLLSTAVL